MKEKKLCGSPVYRLWSTCCETDFHSSLTMPQYFKLREGHFTRYSNGIRTLIPFIADISHCISDFNNRNSSLNSWKMLDLQNIRIEFLWINRNICNQLKIIIIKVEHVFARSANIHPRTRASCWSVYVIKHLEPRFLLSLLNYTFEVFSFRFSARFYVFLFRFRRYNCTQQTRQIFSQYFFNIDPFFLCHLKWIFRNNE